VEPVAGFLDLSINKAFVAIFDHNYVAQWGGQVFGSALSHILIPKSKSSQFLRSGL
jgi:hypothetical protein